MYWSKQENIIFDIILFLIVFFQFITTFVLTGDVDNQTSLVLVGLNFIFFGSMIPYAKWVWKTASYRKAFLQVVKHELYILGLSIPCLLLAILAIILKQQI